MPDAIDMAGVWKREQSALEKIYRRHSSAIFGLSRRVLSDDGLAQDVSQEILLRLWNEPQRFDASRGSLRSFLLRETHSRSIEKVRSEEARRQREIRSDARDRDSSPTLEAEVLASLSSETVRNALLTLSDDERSVIVLAYYSGRSYREVAKQLDLPEGTVKSRIRSGLRKLSSLLDVTGLEVQE